MVRQSLCQTKQIGGFVFAEPSSYSPGSSRRQVNVYIMHIDFLIQSSAQRCRIYCQCPSEHYGTSGYLERQSGYRGSPNRGQERPRAFFQVSKSRFASSLASG